MSNRRKEQEEPNIIRTMNRAPVSVSLHRRFKLLVATLSDHHLDAGCILHQFRDGGCMICSTTQQISIVSLALQPTQKFRTHFLYTSYMAADESHSQPSEFRKHMLFNLCHIIKAMSRRWKGGPSVRVLNPVRLKTTGASAFALRTIVQG